jgi:heme-degrading monooxygenase HmoA
MYALVARRTMHDSRTQETTERAHNEFYPKLRRPPGFKTLSLIRGDDGIVTSVIVFESKDDFDAFQLSPCKEAVALAAGVAARDQCGHWLEPVNLG